MTFGYRVVRIWWIVRERGSSAGNCKDGFLVLVIIIVMTRGGKRPEGQLESVGENRVGLKSSGRVKSKEA
jgi:hypothetical protein